METKYVYCAKYILKMAMQTLNLEEIEKCSLGITENEKGSIDIKSKR